MQEIKKIKDFINSKNRNKMIWYRIFLILQQEKSGLNQTDKKVQILNNYKMIFLKFQALIYKIIKIHHLKMKNNKPLQISKFCLKL